MKKKIIMAKRETYKINDREYDYYSLENIKRYSNRKIYLLEEDIFTLYIDERKSRDIKKRVDEEVMALFNENDDCIVHYEKFNREKYIMYSLKGGRRIAALCKGNSFNKVIPIQFELMNSFKRKIKEKEYSFLYYLDKGIYYIKIKNRKIIRSFYDKSLERLMEKVGLKEKLFLYESPIFNVPIMDGYDMVKIKRGRELQRFEKVHFT